MSVVTTGVRNGSVPNRLEIHDFVKDEKFFSLYIKALQEMQKQRQDNPLSFFQISGIHGYPYAPWDGVKGEVAQSSDSVSGGYCTHNNVLFPTWHRPYVALFEQVVQHHAAKIAATYEYALPPDEVIRHEKVSIMGPEGPELVNNPLFNYTFHPVDPSFPKPFNAWKTSLRYPTVEATDDFSALETTLLARHDEVVYKTYTMLTSLNDWSGFSNTLPANQTTSNSIEGIHDQVHLNIGGHAIGIPDATGHMADVAMAAFDPIFYLHHSQVDRLLSLWSALNPGVWMSEGKSAAGTYTIAPGVPVNENTPLTPFRNSDCTFWPSSAVRHTATFGYTYPDFNGLDAYDSQALREAIGARVNELYGWVISGGASAADGTSVPESAPPIGSTSISGNAPLVSAASSPGKETGCPYLGVYDWTARVQFKKYEVGQSFCVALFFGTVPEDPKQWLTSNKSVGGHYAFVNSQAENCANCVNSADVVIEGFVHLNQALAHLSGLGSLDPEVVEPYLKKELQWRAQKADGEPIDLRSLEVTVFSTPLSYPSGAMFPIRGERRHCGHITFGRPGGSRQL